MRILSLDFEPLYGDGNDVLSKFESDTSCFDFDLVIWDPAASLKSYCLHSSTYQGLPHLSDNVSPNFKAHVERRRKEFADFINSGRTLVVVARPPQECYVATGEVRTSGTGRNAARTVIVDKADLLDAIPMEGLSTAPAAGNRIDVLGGGPLTEFMQKHIGELKYSATLELRGATTVAKIKGTEKVVSAVAKTPAGGLLFLMPSSSIESHWDEESESSEWPEEAEVFQHDLTEALKNLTQGSELSRPAWAQRFATSGTLDLEAAVVKQQASVERARARLAKAQEKADHARLLDQLYLGTGRALELRVADVMKLLGGKVSEPEPGRADWHVDFAGSPVVLEVKGMSKSAAEKHAAQLEKWVAEAIEASGTAPKGVLVVNTWRDVPLDQRDKDDFPAQMLPYSEARNHCLITGLELFVIAQEVQGDPGSARACLPYGVASSGLRRG